MREDLHSLRMRASLDHGKFSVIWALGGPAAERELELHREAVGEYDREPVLV
jgi:hypothetical protein